MKVILKADIQGVGKKGEVVTVKEGYAKNYLFKNNLGVEATDAELNRMKNNEAKEAKKEQKKLEEAKKLAAKLEEKKLKIKVKAGENGKIFGSVTSKEIAELMTKEYKMEIDKKKITISEEHIKATGNYKVIFKIHTEVKATIDLEVEGE